MEIAKFCLHRLPNSAKWAATLYLGLILLGFTVAALMSHQTYGFDHHRTQQFYLGDEAEGGMAFPKLYSQLLQTAHVHSFSMPIVFLSLWVGLAWTPLNSKLKKGIMLGGAFSIMIYNAAPFLVRFLSPQSVFLFTIGGIGLFLFSTLPCALLLFEIWRGFPCNPSI